MKKMKTAVLVMTVAACTLYFTGCEKKDPAPLGPSDAAVKRVLGSCYGLSESLKRSRILEGASLENYKTVQTGKDSRAVLEVRDRYSIYLDAQSEVSFTRGSYKLEAEGVFAFSADNAVVVEITTGTIRMTRAHCLIEARPDALARVLVTSGKVEITPATLNESVVLEAGYFANVVRGAKITPLRLDKRTATDAFSWTEETGLKLETSNLPGILHGTVTDESGRPVASAEITATSNDGSLTRELATYGTEGRFQWNDAEPGAWSLWVRAEGYAEKTIPGVVIQGGEEKDIRIELVKDKLKVNTNKGNLTGKTTNAETGKIVRGVKLVFMGKNYWSNERGYFTLQDLPAGAHVLEAEADGYQPWAFEVTVKAGETVMIPVKLSPAPEEKEVKTGDLLVFVRGKDLEAMQGVTVKAGTGSTRLPVAITGDTGSVMFPDLEPGIYEITISKTGYSGLTEKISVEKGKTAEAILTLKKKP